MAEQPRGFARRRAEVVTPLGLPTADAVQRGAEQATRYEARILFQQNRISKLVAFLEERGLLNDFNEWEEAGR